LKNEIIIFENQEVQLEVNLKDETVWLTQKQMAELFCIGVKTISKHIINIYTEELEENSNSQKMRIANSDKLVRFYNLDTIISVGYRVKSSNGIVFRKWANKILKDYMLKGYAANERRLAYLEKTVQLIDVASRLEEEYKDHALDILAVIKKYSKAFYLLDQYDHGSLEKLEGNLSSEKIRYESCLEIIAELKKQTNSTIFALERNYEFQSIINDIYQTFDHKDLYKSIEEKGVNFFYMIIKNHAFIDGNKRIAATLFIYFLQFYGILKHDSKAIIDHKTLTALTLLIAESNPKEKQVMIDLVMNLLIEE